MPERVGVALRHVIFRLSVLLRAEMLHVTFVCAAVVAVTCVQVPAAIFIFCGKIKMAAIANQIAKQVLKQGSKIMRGAGGTEGVYRVGNRNAARKTNIWKEMAKSLKESVVDNKKAILDEVKDYAYESLAGNKRGVDRSYDLRNRYVPKRGRMSGATGFGKLRDFGGTYGGTAVVKNKKWSRRYRRRRGRRLVRRFLRSSKRISASAQMVIEYTTVTSADKEHSWGGFFGIFDMNSVLVEFELADPARLVCRGSTGVVPEASAFVRDDFREMDWFYHMMEEFVLTIKNPVAVPLNVSLLIFQLNEGSDEQNNKNFWKDAPPYLMNTFKNLKFRNICRHVNYYKKMVVQPDGVGSFRCRLRPGFLQARHGDITTNPERDAKIVRYAFLTRCWFPMQNEGVIGAMPTFYNLNVAMNGMLRYRHVCYVPMDSNLKSSVFMYNWSADDPKFGDLRSSTFVSSDMQQVATRTATPAA